MQRKLVFCQFSDLTQVFLPIQMSAFDPKWTLRCKKTTKDVLDGGSKRERYFLLFYSGTRVCW